MGEQATRAEARKQGAGGKELDEMAASEFVVVHGSGEYSRWCPS